jgi:hypothetical protein
VPGTVAYVPTDHELGPGDQVLVVFEHADGTLGSVGTSARIADAREPSFGGLVIDVVGEALVHMLGSRRLVDAQSRPAGGLVATTRTLLRRYMAARVEAGEPGDIAVDLPEDPVAASHRVASHLRISWPEIQEILEAGDAVDRLRFEDNVLERETLLLRAVMARPPR